MNQLLKQKIKKIKLLAMDVDGVLTDGRIVFDSEGKELKFFDVQDGCGLAMFQKMGYKTAIITAKSSRVVRLRAKELHIDKVYLNAFPKTKAYQQMLQDFRVKDEEVCFIGDDLPDVPLLQKCGFSATVSNGAKECKTAADYVTKRRGGRGAVRELIERILKTNNQWKKVMAKCLQNC